MMKFMNRFFSDYTLFLIIPFSLSLFFIILFPSLPQYLHQLFDAVRREGGGGEGEEVRGVNQRALGDVRLPPSALPPSLSPSAPPPRCLSPLPGGKESAKGVEKVFFFF